MHYAKNGKWGGDAEYGMAGGGGRLSLAAQLRRNVLGGGGGGRGGGSLQAAYDIQSD
jgi:hypothetical protein